VALASLHGLGRIEVANRPMSAFTRLYACDVASALQEAQAAIRAAQRVGHARAEIIAHHAAYFCRREMGDLEAAMDDVEQALAIALALKARRFEAETLCFRAELLRMAGDIPEALEDARRSVELSRQTGVAYVGPVALGTLARVTADREERGAALAEADAILDAGAVSHNYFLFPRDAIDLHIELGEWARVERYAERIDTYQQREPMPFSDYIVARARALAAWGRGRREDELRDRLAQLRDTGDRLGSLISLPEINAALSVD
jgi:tetratricopeptide (TPR) repeat protein